MFPQIAFIYRIKQMYLSKLHTEKFFKRKTDMILKTDSIKDNDIFY